MIRNVSRSTNWRLSALIVWLGSSLSLWGQLPGGLPFAPPVPTADPQELLSKLAGGSVTDLQAAAKGISAYPETTRNAILTLAAYTLTNPNLLTDLQKVRQLEPSAIDQYLTSNNFPVELQTAAATVLVDAPATIDAMIQRPDLVAVVGKAWSNPVGRELISQVLEKTAQSQAELQQQSAQRWAQRLAADPNLMNQYTQLLQQYTAQQYGGQQNTTQSNSSASVDQTWQSYDYGIIFTDGSYTVTNVPSEEVIAYTLAYGYQYTAVANALIYQYLNELNQEDYASAVGGWYAVYGDSIPAEYRQQYGQYYDTLAELGRYEEYRRTAAAAANSGIGQTAVQTGSEYISKAASEYPQLSSYLQTHPENLATAAPGPAGVAGPIGSRTPFTDRLGDKPPATGTRPGLLGDSPFPGLPGTRNNPAAAAGPKSLSNPAAPFTSRLQATPPNQRGGQSLGGQQTPFNFPNPQSFLPGQTPGGPAQPKPTPTNPMPTSKSLPIKQGMPSLGNQLNRAPRQMQSAFRGPQGGKPKMNSGPRPGDGPPGGAGAPGGPGRAGGPSPGPGGPRPGR